MLGPGKYDKECTDILEDNDAMVCMVMVIGGTRGHGFSINVDMHAINAEVLNKIPETLRDVAATFEKEVLFK
jgi:hypothetical protein